MINPLKKTREMVILFLGFVTVVSCADREVLQLDGRHWRPWMEGDSVHEIANFKIEMNQCKLSSLGINQARHKVIDDLVSMSKVPGHPVLVLRMSGAPASCDQDIIDDIEKTGVCDDQSCFYQYYRK